MADKEIKTSKYVVKFGHRFGFGEKDFYSNQEVELNDDDAAKLAEHIQTPAEHKKEFDARMNKKQQ